jgi:RNA polymerase sigma factor for flagellar operon FliA
MMLHWHTSPEEDEEKLWLKFKKHGDREARERLILKYVGLVKYVIDRMMISPPPGLDFDDIYSCGITGLIEAIDRYQLDYGTSFISFALRRIKGAILDESKKLGWVPRTTYHKQIELEKAYAQLENLLGRPATDEEIADYLSLSLDQFHDLVCQVSQITMLSLYQLAGGGEDDEPIEIVDTIQDTRPDPQEQLEVKELKKALAESIEKLPEKEKLVIILYYYEGLTLKEIGAILKVTESRVSQIHTKAVLRIRGKLRRFIDETKRSELGCRPR